MLNFIKSYFLRNFNRLPGVCIIDSGCGRVGVQPGEPALVLARHIAGLPGVSFEGVLAFAGHSYDTAGEEALRHESREEGRLAAVTVALIEAAGIPVSVVSVGSGDAPRPAAVRAACGAARGRRRADDVSRLAAAHSRRMRHTVPGGAGAMATLSGRLNEPMTAGNRQREPNRPCFDWLFGQKRATAKK